MIFEKQVHNWLIDQKRRGNTRLFWFKKAIYFLLDWYE